MTVRVLRLLEYIYDDHETAERDMRGWAVQGEHQPNSRVLIRSMTLNPITEPETAFENL